MKEGDTDFLVSWQIKNLFSSRSFKLKTTALFLTEFYFNNRSNWVLKNLLPEQATMVLK